jgi:hypothetical protein
MPAVRGVRQAPMPLDSIGRIIGVKVIGRIDQTLPAFTQQATGVVGEPRPPERFEEEQDEDEPS